MSTEHPEGGQPAGQLSPDGNWRWDGHNWVPARQAPAPGAQQPFQQGQQPPPQQQPQQPPPQQQPQQPYAQQQPQYPQQQPYAQQPYGQQYGGMPPGTPPKKKGLPTWAKILIGLLVLFVGLIALLTIVGLTMEEDYADWSCEDIGKEAVRISEENDGVLVLKDVTGLSIEEDNRETFTPPEEGRGIVVSCTGDGEWDPLGDAPVTVTLEVGKDGEEWVGYEMTE
jgi:hypothetical protein